MMKNNPLFVDSTKLRGEQISIQMELRQIVLYEGEGVFLRLKNREGNVVRVPMTALNNGGFEARTWVGHQEPISFQFVIEKDGNVVFMSAVHKAQAQYMIIERWEAQLEGTLLETSRSPSPELSPGVRAQGQSLRALAEKWGF